MEAAKTMSALDAGDAQRVMQLAGAAFFGVESTSQIGDKQASPFSGRVRAAVRDLRTASRMKQLEQVNLGNVPSL